MSIFIYFFRVYYCFIYSNVYIFVEPTLRTGSDLTLEDKLFILSRIKAGDSTSEIAMKLGVRVTYIIYLKGKQDQILEEARKKFYHGKKKNKHSNLIEELQGQQPGISFNPIMF